MKFYSILLSCLFVSSVASIQVIEPRSAVHVSRQDERQLPSSFFQDSIQFLYQLSESLQSIFSSPDGTSPLDNFISQLNAILDALAGMQQTGDKEVELNEITASDYPSSAPSDAPSLMPSDAPSMMPSDAPSMMPSDAPSMAPSDVPSMAPSLAPSDMPSDFPSNAPVSWNEATLELPEGYDVCGFSEGVEFDMLNEVQVVYLYKLVLEAGAELAAVTRKIEDELHKAVLRENCVDASTRHRSLARAHGVSPNPSDLPSASCGIDCFFMIGRVSLLVDSDTIDEYRGVYCETLGSIREEIIGGLSYVEGVSSTTLLSDGPDVPQICNFPQMVPPNQDGAVSDDANDGDNTSREPAGSIEGLSYENAEEGANLWLLVFGFAGVGSAAALLVAIVVRRRRRAGRQVVTVRHSRGKGSDAAADDEEAAVESLDLASDHYDGVTSPNNHSLSVVIDEVPYPSQSDNDSVYYTSGAEDEKEEENGGRLGILRPSPTGSASGYMSLPPRAITSPVSSKSTLSVP